MDRRTAADAPDLTAAFNRVYEGYLLPLRLTDEQMVAHVSGNDVDLARSPWLTDEAGETAAIALLGVRGDRGWVGGFGVAPPLRGRGVGAELCAAVVEEARAAGVRRLQLEVLVDNAAAIALYARFGFTVVRDVVVLAPPDDAPHDALPAGGAARPLAWQREGGPDPIAGRLTNEPEGSALAALAVARGWRAVARQHEMALDLG